MANQVDKEMDRLRSERSADSAKPKGEALKELVSLKQQIETSRAAGDIDLDVNIENDELTVSVKGQAIGLWRCEGPDLALYRPGSRSAESHATNAAEAAKMSARLIAAAGQA